MTTTAAAALMERSIRDTKQTKAVDSTRQTMGGQCKQRRRVKPHLSITISYPRRRRPSVSEEATADKICCS